MLYLGSPSTKTGRPDTKTSSPDTKKGAPDAGTGLPETKTGPLVRHYNKSAKCHNGSANNAAILFVKSTTCYSRGEYKFSFTGYPNFSILEVSFVYHVYEITTMMQSSLISAAI